MDQVPSVGRMVHYHSYGTPGGEYKPKPRAAIITEVNEEAIEKGGTIEETMTVGICVLNPTGQFFTLGVKYSPTPKSGHWNWPPRV